MKHRVPDLMLQRVTDITPELLHTHGVRALILDVDNTLTLPGEQELSPGVREWLSDMKSHNIGLAIVSNNKRERVEPFARKVGVMYISRAMKPLSRGYLRAVRLMSIPKEHVAVVGDQIFTDIVGAKYCKLRAWLVEPFVPEDGPFFRFKRKMEKKPIEFYRRKNSEENHG